MTPLRISRLQLWFACFGLLITCPVGSAQCDRSYQAKVLQDVIKTGAGFTIFYRTGEAEQLTNQQRYPEAEKKYESVLEVMGKHFKKGHIAFAGPLNNLGMIQQLQRKYKEAEKSLKEALAIREKILGKDHLDVAQSLNNLAVLHNELGDVLQAERELLRCLKIYENCKQTDSLEMAPFLNSIAQTSLVLGNYPRALQYLKQVDELLEKKGKSQSSVRAEILGTWALYHAKLGKFTEAEKALQQSLKIHGNGRRDPVVCFRYLSLAWISIQLNKLEQAKELLEKNEQFNLHWKKRIPHLAVVHKGIVEDYLVSSGKWAEAEKQIQENYKEVAANFADQNWFPMSNRFRLGIVYVHQKKWKQAEKEFEVLHQALHARLTAILPKLSSGEQAQFLPTWRAMHTVLISLALGQPQDEGIVNRTATWQLNWKARGTEVIGQRLANVRIAKGDRKAEQLLRELDEVRQQLGNLVYVRSSAALTTKAADATKQCEQLLAQERKLSQELARHLGQQHRNAYVDLEKLRQAIPKDAVVIDIAHCAPSELLKSYFPGTEPRYLGWIIPAAGEGKVKFVDFGEAQKIDKSVAKFQQILPTIKFEKQLLSKETEQKCRQRLQPVTDSLLSKLQPHIKGKKTLIISPDGELWNVPWGALPLADNQYLVEKHDIRVVISGRDLLRSPTPREVKPGKSLIVANPAFDGNVAEKKSKPEDQPTSVLSAFLGKRIPTRVSPLKLTEVEARAILPLVKKYTGTEPAFKVGIEASESAIRNSHHPRMVVIGTHGFYLRGEESSSSWGRGITVAPLGAQPAATEVAGQPEALPLLRCGLLLAGYNNRDANNPGDDSILTGLEIASCDFQGTELAVLSACRTGQGQLQPGEGQASLRQAFHLAGAETVVATLWDVPEHPETVRLVVGFFNALSKEASKTESLCKAQRQLIQELRKRHQAASPLVWASYVLTGEGPAK